MVILDVFTKNIQITYQSTIISKATILVLILSIFTIVLPFIFAFKTRGFWLKRDVLYEQPNVKFKGEYIFLATTNNSSFLITCSSLSFYKQRFENYDTCSAIKVREVDYNFDGIVDELDLSLHLYLPNNHYITSISLIIPLDYTLKKSCSFHMQTVLIYQQFLSFQVSRLSIIGDLQTRQTAPIFCHHKHIFYNNSLIIEENNIKSYKIDNIIQEHTKRNISTILTNIFSTFSVTNRNLFNLDITIKYPEHNIKFKPGFWQIIKWAWIQYLSIFILVAWIINKLKEYLFNKRIVLYYMKNPLKEKLK